MTIENIISPIEDRQINSHIQDSPIWSKAIKEEELVVKPDNILFKYTIKFNGTIPVQCTKIEKI